MQFRQFKEKTARRKNYITYFSHKTNNATHTQIKLKRSSFKPLRQVASPFCTSRKMKRSTIKNNYVEIIQMVTVTPKSWYESQLEPIFVPDLQPFLLDLILQLYRGVQSQQKFYHFSSTFFRQAMLSMVLACNIIFLNKIRKLKMYLKT